MSENLTLSGKEFIPASLAGKRFGYTGDYISKLAREGCVSGTKVGHQWFVLEQSVRDFIEHKTKEKTKRSEAVRMERKRELQDHKSRLEATKKEAVKTRHLVALTETIVILVLGLSIGVSGYVMTTPVNQSASLASTSYSAFERLAISLYELLTGRETVVIDENRETKSEDRALGEASDGSGEIRMPVAVGEAPASLVVLPEETFTATTAKSVREAFSDEVTVTVDSDNPDTGIIVPHFRDSNGETYRYLIVPVIPEKNGG